MKFFSLEMSDMVGFNTIKHPEGYTPTAAPTNPSPGRKLGEPIPLHVINARKEMADHIDDLFNRFGK